MMDHSPSPRSNRRRRESATSKDQNLADDHEKSRQKESYSTSLDREMKKLEDCWNLDSPRKDPDKRHLRSGLCLSSEKDIEIEKNNKKQESSTEDCVEEETKQNLKRRKSNEKSEKSDDCKMGEEIFIRRKKLRSEVSQDELWEGILDIRFKRLTPIKARKEAMQTKMEENKCKDELENNVTELNFPDIDYNKDRQYDDFDRKHKSKINSIKDDNKDISEANDRKKDSRECRKARSLAELFDELLHAKIHGENEGNQSTATSNELLPKRGIASEMCNENLSRDVSTITDVTDGTSECCRDMFEVDYSVFKVVVELLTSMVSTVEDQLEKEMQKGQLKEKPRAQCSKGQDVATPPKRSARIHEKQQHGSSANQNSIYLYTGLKKSHEHTLCANMQMESKVDVENEGVNIISPLLNEDKITTKSKYQSHDTKKAEKDCMQNGSTSSLDASDKDEICEKVSKNGYSSVDEDDNDIERNNQQLVTLKFKVKKTENGTTIIPVGSPSLVCTENTTESKGESIHATPNEKKLSAKIRANSARNSPKSQDGDNGASEIRTPKEEMKRNKQTRSRTRSGEGEITDLQTDPENILKQPRVKGKNLSSVQKSEGKQKSRSKKRKVILTPEKKTTASKGKQSNYKQQRQSKRRSTANDMDLLKNQRLAKHACVLWSSEQRRHFQLSHSGRSSEDIDQIMRKAWTNLDDKEKLRYFQRAYSATTDENKHSEPVKPKRGSKLSKEANDKVSKAMTKFNSMNGVEQDEELRKWLRMLNDVSTDEYSKLMSEFRVDLKNQRQKRKERHNPVTDTQEFCRTLLFSNIMNKMDMILELYQNKRDKQKLLIKEAFDVNIKRLIDGDKVSFSPDAQSDRLSEVLLDLKNLEDEKKLAVSGTPLKSDSYNDILKSIKEAETELNGQVKCPDLLKDIPEVNSMSAAKVLSTVSSDPLPELQVDDEDDFITYMNTVCKPLTRDEAASLADYFEKEALQAHSSSADDKSCCDLESPSCVLTSLLMSDKLRNFVSNQQSSFDGGGHIDVSKLTVRPSGGSEHGKPRYKVRTVLMTSANARMYGGSAALNQAQQKFIVKEAKYPRILHPSHSA